MTLGERKQNSSGHRVLSGMKNFELNKQTSAWIIGASSGIGRALALCLYPQVKQVFVTARRAGLLHGMVQETTGQETTGQGRIIPLAADLADLNSMKNAIAQIREHGNLPDLIIIAAALYEPGPSATVTPEQITQQLAVNLGGPAQLCTALLPDLLEDTTREHVLVFVASVAGFCGLPHAGIYGATKAGLISYAESLRAELQGSSVRVQLVTPGFVATPMTARNDFPMPFLMTAEQAAGQIICGLGRNGFEITFPRRLSWALKILRVLPYRLFFALTRRLIAR